MAGGRAGQLEVERRRKRAGRARELHGFRQWGVLHGRVGGTRGRGLEVVDGAGAAGAGQTRAIGNIGALVWKSWRELGRSGDAIGFDQCQIFAVRIEAEVGMEPFRRIAAILAGSENDEIALGREGDSGKRPAFFVAGVIGQIPAPQVYGRGIGIKNFDPIGKHTVFIGERGRV